MIDTHANPLDKAMAVYFQSPHSFTGEDVVEFHCHGGLVLLKKVVAEILSLSFPFHLRGAEPGEFSRRSFLNGKIDLTQAEAIHEIITADSDAALRASLSNLDGALKKRVMSLKDQLQVSLALIEASFEFPEEDIQTYDRKEVFGILVEAKQMLSELHQAFSTSKLFDEGISVAIVGKPNVGKSSLLNAILIEERAIVTNIPGTTRDIVEGSRMLDGIRFVFRDTAGIRDTADVVESAGIERSKEWMAKSDIILSIHDSEHLGEDETIVKAKHQTLFKILNKSDLLPEDDLNKLATKFDYLVSAKTGLGVENLLQALKDTVKAHNSVQNTIHINARQNQKIGQCLENISKINQLNKLSLISEELLAEEIRELIRHLEEITGEITSDDVLGEIFKRFCIGK